MDDNAKRVDIIFGGTGTTCFPRPRLISIITEKSGYVNYLSRKAGWVSARRGRHGGQAADPTGHLSIVLIVLLPRWVGRPTAQSSLAREATLQYLGKAT